MWRENGLLQRQNERVKEDDFTGLHRGEVHSVSKQSTVLIVLTYLQLLQEVRRSGTLGDPRKKMGGR